MEPTHWAFGISFACYLSHRDRLCVCTWVKDPQTCEFFRKGNMNNRLRVEEFTAGYYGLCAAGGMLSAGVTHLSITPLDVLKVNMQVCLEIVDSSYSRFMFLWFTFFNLFGCLIFCPWPWKPLFLVSALLFFVTCRSWADFFFFYGI